MAEKGFGVKEVNLIGASGTPTITSPNNLNLNAVNVAISTNATVGGTLSVTGNVSVGGTLTYEDVTNIDSVGIVTAREGVFIPDNKTLKIGNTASNPDFIFYHDGTSTILTNNMNGTTGAIVIQPKSGEEGIKTFPDGAVELYHNNVKRLETSSVGVSIPQDLDVDGHTNLDNVSAVGFTTIGQGNFAYTPQSSSWATSSAINLIGNYGGGLSFNDNGNGGFVQYIDGNGSNFNIKSGAIGGATATSIKCVKDGSVELYHGGNKKLETSSSGATVTGTLSATTFSGSGASLTNLPVADSDIQVAYTVTANGSSAYRFAGNGVVSSADNPDLYLIRGQKYRFINNSGGSHPFQIREASGGTAYSTGVTNNGAASGNIDFAPTYDSPAQLVYQCTSHGGMVGNIYLRDAAGNNVNVGVTTFIGHVQANNIKLDRGSATEYALRVDTTSSTGATRISFDESGTSKGQLAYSHDNNQVELIGRSGQSAVIITDVNKTGFIVDTSGYVTKPLNPVFHAYNGPSNVNANNDIVFSQERFDIGSAYNTSNGIYTVPKTGYYHFYGVVYRQNSSDDSYWGFFINGSQRSEARLKTDVTNSSAGYSTLPSSIYWYCSSGDEVKCRCISGSIHCNTNFSYFSGNLIG